MNIGSDPIEIRFSHTFTEDIRSLAVGFIELMIAEGNVHSVVSVTDPVLASEEVHYVDHLPPVIELIE